MNVCLNCSHLMGAVDDRVPASGPSRDGLVLDGLRELLDNHLPSVHPLILNRLVYQTLNVPTQVQSVELLLRELSGLRMRQFTLREGRKVIARTSSSPRLLGAILDFEYGYFASI